MPANHRPLTMTEKLTILMTPSDMRRLKKLAGDGGLAHWIRAAIRQAAVTAENK